MKEAIVTAAIGEKYQQIKELTHSSISFYAEKIEADFIVLDNENKQNPHWNKFKLYKLLQKYDRILWLDSDLIIREDCPDLFSIIPYDKIGLFEEGRFVSREEYIKGGMGAYNFNFEWNGKYYNTGVMLISKYHAQLFAPIDDKIIDSNQFVSKGMIYSFLGEQTFLNLRLLSNDILSKNVFDLNHKFNRMTLMDAVTGEPRQAAYVIHYAGCPSLDLMLDLIQKDLKIWERDRPDYNYKKNIVLSFSGGLGDQVCGEPIARYYKTKLFPIDNLIILTHFPEIFQHLDIPIYKPDHKFDFGEGPYSVREVYPRTNQPIWNIITNSLINATDFGSIAACGRILPDENRGIYLEPNDQGMREISSLIDLEELKNYILIHPGKGFFAKSFPAQWWDQIIQGLLDNGFKIGVIGKKISDTQGYIDISKNENIIDFRDFLSLNGLFAIIKYAKVLVTNDSAPVHIAGAFDNWIVLIPTMKHPDHVLPYRKGDRHYKTKVLYKKLTVDDSYHYSGGQRLDQFLGDLEDYLPNTKQVVSTILEIEDLKNGL